MAVSTITYSNKVALNENPSVADINKVKADDMNEIKTVVNNNATEISKNTTNIADITGTVLWTNDSPTSSFGSQSITLSSDDYDILEIYYRSGPSSTDYMTSTRVIKGNSAILQMNHISSNVYHRSRKMNYVNDTSYSVDVGQQCPTNTSSLDNNAGYIIPLYIIGYKTGLFD